jgi:hypothetical protein
MSSRTTHPCMPPATEEEQPQSTLTTSSPSPRQTSSAPSPRTSPRPNRPTPKSTPNCSPTREGGAVHRSRSRSHAGEVCWEATATVAGPSPQRRRQSAVKRIRPIATGEGGGQPVQVLSATRKRSSEGTLPPRPPLSAAQVCASTAVNPQPGPERASSTAAPLLSKAMKLGCKSRRRWSSIRRSRPLAAAVSLRRQPRRRSPCGATMGPNSCDRLPKLARSSHLQQQQQQQQSTRPHHHQHPRRDRQRTRIPPGPASNSCTASLATPSLRLLTLPLPRAPDSKSLRPAIRRRRSRPRTGLALARTPAAVAAERTRSFRPSRTRVLLASTGRLGEIPIRPRQPQPRRQSRHTMTALPHRPLPTRLRPLLQLPFWLRRRHWSFNSPLVCESENGDESISAAGSLGSSYRQRQRRRPDLRPPLQHHHHHQQQAFRRLCPL